MSRKFDTPNNGPAPQAHARASSIGAVTTNLGRRRLLWGAAAGGALVIAPPFLKSARGDSLHLNAALFTLGVGSGDPTPDSVVLWTRLAPEPLDGGGMPDRPVKVGWEIAEDYGMTRVIRRSSVVASPRNGHAVHVVALGLPSNRWLHYRFKALGQTSRVGRTRTFPAYGDDADHMRCGVVSCQNYTQGFYTAYRDLLDQKLDFVVHTGDYIYESGPAGFEIAPNRNHVGGEIYTVEDYRNRYALYRLDADLQEAHAELPFVVTQDDHEVDNNYAGKLAEETAPFQGDDFLIRQRNAYQVYSETMPLRPVDRQHGNADRRLYRKLAFGNLAHIYMLDTRQFRSDQPAEDGFGSTDSDSLALEPVLGENLFDADGILDPNATMLGKLQERWLARHLSHSRAMWNVLAQQVMVMPWNLVSTAKAFVAANLAQQPIPPEQKALILAAFDHVDNISQCRCLGRLPGGEGTPAWNDTTQQRAQPDRANRRYSLCLGRRPAGRPWRSPVRSGGRRVCCTSISSTFLALDPRPTDFIVRLGLQDNPHIRYFNGLFRGYCVCDVDNERWQTTYRAVGDLTALADLDDPLALVPFPDTPVATDAVLEIEQGFNQPGSGKRLEKTFSRFPP